MLKSARVNSFFAQMLPANHSDIQSQKESQPACTLGSSKVNSSCERAFKLRYLAHFAFQKICSTCVTQECATSDVRNSFSWITNDP